MPILLKLHRCFGYGLKMCMWFGYNPQIIFCHFFRNLNFVFFRHYNYQQDYVDSMYLVRVTPPIPLLFVACGHPPPHCENTQVLREAITEDDDDDDDDDDEILLISDDSLFL